MPRAADFPAANEPHPGPRIISWIFVIALAVAGGGCGGTITPPWPVHEPVSVYVADYGRHATLLLPTEDGGLEEFAFGDWRWLATGHRQWYDVPASSFCSGGSTLGRRYFRPPPPPDQFLEALKAERYVSFFVERERAAALRDELNRKIEGAIDTARPSADGDGFVYVRATEGYCIFHNCNHVTARWLRELDCRVHGMTMTSRFVVAQREPRGGTD
jgi:hypothetical protein